MLVSVMPAFWGAPLLWGLLGLPFQRWMNGDMGVLLACEAPAYLSALCVFGYPVIVLPCQ